MSCLLPALLLVCWFRVYWSDPVPTSISTTKTTTSPTFAEIFQEHQGENALRRTNNIEIYDREFAFYRTQQKKFPELSLLQIGDDLSLSLPFQNIGGGVGK
tara:strand:- start:3 stop:305 length:303 start_codon:yes stop_codon:yes gene_type:complete